MSNKNQIIGNLPEITSVDANNNIIGLDVDDINVGNLSVSGNLSVVASDIDLGPVETVHIEGGANGQVLTTNGSGNLSWTTVGSNATGVTQIVAGNNVTIDPAGGTGVVTINSVPVENGVVRIIAGNNITISPEDGTGAVTINATGGGSSTPGGADTQLQYNNNGNFGGIPSVTYNSGVFTISDIEQLSIGGGDAQFVLSTDGNGNLSWVPQGGGGGGSILFQTVAWQAGLGPATDAYYWNGAASVPNPKPLLISYIIPDTANQINLLTIDGTAVSNATITVTDTGFTVPAVNIPNNVQTATDALTMILKVSNSGTNIELGQTVLTPVLEPLDPFTTTGTLTATPTNPTAVPYWLTQGNGTVTASGLQVGGGSLANVTYTLLQNSSSIATSPVRTSFSNYQFTNVPVGTGYSLSAAINGVGLHGADPTVATTVTSTGTVNIVAQTYTPTFTKLTNSATVPTFTTSDTYIAQPFSIGQNVPAPATDPGEYFWIATPTNTPRTFKFFAGSLEVVVTPDASGTNTISGQAYNVYGFTAIDTPIILIIS